MLRHPVVPTPYFARLAQETLLASNCCSEGKPRRCQHCFSLVTDKVAQELLAAEKAELAKAAARRQKKARKKSKIKNKQKEKLHLADEMPEEDAEDTDLAADEALNSGAGPSTSSNALASVQEVCSLPRAHCVDQTTVSSADADVEISIVLTRVFGRPSNTMLIGACAATILGLIVDVCLGC